MLLRSELLHCLALCSALQSFVFTLSCMHSIPAVLLFALLVCGHSLFEECEFYL